MAETTESLSVIIPCHNAGPLLERLLPLWAKTLDKLNIPHEILVVNDGSTDETAKRIEAVAQQNSAIRILNHEKKQGYGAACKTAIAEAKHPLLLFTAVDYPYTPGDLPLFLQRIQAKDERIQQTTSLIVGCRTGRETPLFWQIFGSAYRTFCRVVLGIPIEKVKGWLGLSEHLRSWRAWVVYGVPFQDPNCAYKLIRRSLLDRFPIQSNGEFFHVEIAAKSTFLTAILDEIPLTPQLDPIPATEWSESAAIFRKAEFHAPPQPTPAN
ncbi:MAG: glycosyltransferase family 2 protein [Fimbriiglobus sp.]